MKWLVVGLVVLEWVVITVVGLVVTIGEDDDTRATQLPHLQVLLNACYVVLAATISIVTTAFGILSLIHI